MAGIPIALRCDGSTEIGLGHVIRCLSLSSELEKKGWSPLFIVRDLHQAVNARIEAAELPIKKLPPSVGIREDIQMTLDILSREDVPVIVVDSYRLNAGTTKVFKDNGAMLVTIDDLGEGHFQSDLLVNQNVHAPDLHYHVAPYTKLLLGPRYAMLRADLRKHRQDRGLCPEKALEKILVMFGGGDPTNQTGKVMKALRDLQGSISISVVAGGANPHLEKLEDEARTFPHPMELFVDLPEVGDVMCDIDLAVTAAGSTCWELCCLGIPSLLITIADNQREIAAGLDEERAAIHLGWHDQVEGKDIVRGVQAMLNDPDRVQSMSRRAASLVDGLGSERVSVEITRTFTQMTDGTT